MLVVWVSTPTIKMLELWLCWPSFGCVVTRWYRRNGLIREKFEKVRWQIFLLKYHVYGPRYPIFPQNFDKKLSNFHPWSHILFLFQGYLEGVFKFVNVHHYFSLNFNLLPAYVRCKGFNFIFSHLTWIISFILGHLTMHNKLVKLLCILSYLNAILLQSH